LFKNIFSALKPETMGWLLKDTWLPGTSEEVKISSGSLPLLKFPLSLYQFVLLLEHAFPLFGLAMV
jgi:hypothetical protein